MTLSSEAAAITRSLRSLTSGKLSTTSYHSENADRWVVSVSTVFAHQFANAAKGDIVIKRRIAQALDRPMEDITVIFWPAQGNILLVAKKREELRS